MIIVLIPEAIGFTEAYISGNTIIFDGYYAYEIDIHIDELYEYDISY